MGYQSATTLARCLWTASLLQIILRSAVSQTTDDITCSFPPFLTSRSYWEARVSYERRIIGTVWSFTSSVATSTDANSPANTITFSYQCIHSIVSPIGTTVFVEVTSAPFITDDSQQSVAGFIRKKFVGYRCLRFVERSSNIVQVFKSTSDSQAPDPNWCSNGPPIALDEYPLVWPRPDGNTTKVQCGIIGGYKFALQLSNSSNNADQLCANTPLQPVMESECGRSGEGISFDFRLLNCMGNLTLPVVTTLRCLAAWNDSASGYAFTILTNADQTWPRLWMLRTPSARQNFSSSFFGYISTEIATNYGAQMTPRSAVDFAYAIKLTATSFGSLCEDEASGCKPSLCNTINVGGLLSETSCQKTCRTCLADSGGTGNCSFTNDVIGSWLEISSDPVRMNRTIIIDRQTVRFSDKAYQSICVDFNIYSPANVKIPQRYPIVTLYTSTGCRPRYACLQLVRRSDSVMTYEIGQAIQWPYNQLNAKGELQQLSAAILCDDSMFQNVDPAVVILQNSPITTVQCQLPTTPGWLQLNGNLSDDKPVQAAISHCDGSSNIDSFHYSTISSPNVSAVNELNDDNHNCIGVFYDASTGDQYIATVASGFYYCWLFQRRPWTSYTLVYVTKASDCNWNTGNDVSGYSGIIATFVVVPPTERVVASSLTQPLYAALSSDCTNLLTTVTFSTSPSTLTSTPLKVPTITTATKLRPTESQTNGNKAATFLTSDKHYAQIISAFAIMYVSTVTYKI